MTTWDRYDVFIAVLATGAILCLAAGIGAIINAIIGSLFRVADDQYEMKSARIAAGIVTFLFIGALVADALISIRLLWIVWSTP